MTLKRKRKVKDLIIIVVTAVLTVAALFQLGNIKIESSVDVFVPEDDPVRLINEEIKEEFGSSDTMVLGLEARYTSVLDPAVLTVLQDITERLENLTAVDRVISLTNMDYIQASSEGMEVLPLLEGSDEAALRTFSRRLNDWREMYYGTVISEDLSFSAVIVQPAKSSTEEQQAELYEYLKTLAGEYADENLNFTFAGQPVLKKEISNSIFRDLVILIPLAAILIILVLAVSFRKIEGVLFPLISLIVACLWVTGLIGFLGITFTMATLLVPVLLLVVGSAYGIHLMTHFYETAGARSERLSYEELSVILDTVARRIRVSVILAGVTTAAGFLSQLFSPLSPFRMFGALCAAGIFFALLLTFFLIPAMIRFRYSAGVDPGRFDKRTGNDDQGASGGWINALDSVVRKGRLPVALLSVLIFGTTLLLIPRITVGTNLIEFFSPESKMVQDTEVFNEKLTGTGVVTLLIDAPRAGDVLRPLFLKQLEAFEDWLPANADQVSSVQTVVPGIRRINGIMNADRKPYGALAEEEPELDFFSDFSFTDQADAAEEVVAAEEEQPVPAEGFAPEQDLSFYEIPAEPAKYGMSTEAELHNMLTQYMILYSGSLDMMLNDSLEPDQTLVSIRLNRETSRDVREVITAVEDYWDYSIPEGWTYRIAGNSTFNIVLTDLVSNSQLISLSLSLAIVFVIMLVLFRSIKIALIGMLPVFFALAGIFSFMVILGFNLDIITSLLAALAVGVGIDYAIHFLTAYRRELGYGDPAPLISVYRTTGRAILFNAASVALGFLCLLGSSFIPIRQLGILFAVAMAFAAFSALVVLPMALQLMKKPADIFDISTSTEEKKWKKTTAVS